MEEYRETLEVASKYTSYNGVNIVKHKVCNLT